MRPGFPTIMSNTGVRSDVGRKDTGPQPDKVGSQPGVEGAIGRGRKKEPRSSATNVKFEGKTEGLKGHVFDLHGIDQAEKFNTTLKEITEYAARQTTENPWVVKILRNEKIPTPSIPVKPADGGDADANATMTEIWKEEIKAFVREKKKIEVANEKAYALLWGQTSDRVRVKVQAMKGYEDMKNNQDSIKLIGALRQIAYNVRHKTYFPATRFYTMRRLHHLRQDKGMSLLTYYEKYKSLMDMMDSLEIEAGSDKGMEAFSTDNLKAAGTATPDPNDVHKMSVESYLAIIFILNSNRDHYWKLQEELHNEYLQGIDRYPKTVTDAYALMSDRRHDTSRYSGSGETKELNSGVAFAEIDEASSRTGSTTRANQGCWECGDPNHRRFECPKYAARVKKEQDEKNAEAACGLHSGDEDGNPGDLEETNRTLAASLLLDGEEEFGSEEDKANINFVFAQSGIDSQSNEGREVSIVMNQNIEKCAAAGLIQDKWILLDNQSTVDIFRDGSLLKNKREVRGSLTVHCNAGTVKTNWVGDLPGYGTVWWHRGGIANILSFAKVVDRYEVEFGKHTNYRFKVTKANGEVRYFIRSERGLYYLDAGGSDAAALINTVAENKSKYSTRDYNRALQARRVQDIIGRPGLREYLRILDGGIKNCDVRREDALVAEDCFGTNVHKLQGQKPRVRPKATRTNFTPLPSYIMSKYKNITVCADVMKINSLRFFLSVSKHIFSYYTLLRQR